MSSDADRPWLARYDAHVPAGYATVLYGHPAVLRGELVRAYVTLKAGAEATPDELVAHCRSLLAVYKSPRQVVLVDEIPRTPTGKALRERARSEASTTRDAGG